MGKVWVSGSSYDVKGTEVVTHTIDATVMDIGTNLNFGNLAAVTGYYYSGEGNGQHGVT